MIKPGTYKATVVSHATSETKEGLPQAAVTFAFDCEGPRMLTWYGSFKEKAAPHTIKALLNCGLSGQNLAGPLEIGKEVSIVIDDEQGLDGKVRSKIQWVNALATIKNIIPQDLAKAKLASLEGAVMAARSKLNIHDDDIPF